mmetsp:Transcript_18884/g.45015  ORF Transcript_18884/g.45015 Transcript_18884/m.45015 type:complete len:222 (-) Transcript_18884:554-1219(-)
MHEERRSAAREAPQEVKVVSIVARPCRRSGSGSEGVDSFAASSAPSSGPQPSVPFDVRRRFADLRRLSDPITAPPPPGADRSRVAQCSMNAISSGIIGLASTLTADTPHWTIHSRAHTSASTAIPRVRTSSSEEAWGKRRWSEAETTDMKHTLSRRVRRTAAVRRWRASAWRRWRTSAALSGSTIDWWAKVPFSARESSSRSNALSTTVMIRSKGTWPSPQ